MRRYGRRRRGHGGNGAWRGAASSAKKSGTVGHDSREIPDYFRLVYPGEVIERRTRELGLAISPWAEEAERRSGQQLLGICILRGGVFFFSDLLKSITETVEPSFCRCRSYSRAANSQRGELEMSVPPEGVRGRSVLLVDDICDTGRTLSYVKQYCLDEGALEIRTAALIHRVHPGSVYRPDYVGFDYEGPEWFAGYGMEDRNHRANYPDVYLVLDRAP